MFLSVFNCLGLSVCLSVCEQLHSKTTEWICMKFGVWLWYAVRKKLLTFGGDLDLDLGPGSGLYVCL